MQLSICQNAVFLISIQQENMCMLALHRRSEREREHEELSMDIDV